MSREKTTFEQAAALEKKLRKLDRAHTDKLDALVSKYTAERAELFATASEGVIEILRTGGITP